MNQELTTRDVFQQLDSRLGRVEDDIRSQRAEMAAGFQALRSELRTEIHAVRAQMAASLQGLRDGMNQRFDRLTAMFVSLMVGVGALIIGVAGLWLRR